MYLWEEMSQLHSPKLPRLRLVHLMAKTSNTIDCNVHAGSPNKDCRY